jgi:DNA-binding transcriptional LysR family regulator
MTSMDVTQPALAQQIHRLGLQLGVSLFAHAAARRVSLSLRTARA